MSETRKVKPELAPHKVRPNRKRLAHGAGGEAWWYEDGRGIDVYQHVAPGIVTSARIPWVRLIRAAERCGYRLVPSPRRDGKPVVTPCVQPHCKREANHLGAHVV